MTTVPRTESVPADGCEPLLSPESILYARVLRVGMITGLACLVVTYAIYVFGIMEPYIPLERLSEYYGLPVEEYLEKSGVEPGWSSLFNFRYADFLNYLGIVILAGITVVCYAAMLPLLLKRGDKAYAAIAILEIVVLVLAASGVLAGGR